MRHLGSQMPDLLAEVVLVTCLFVPAWTTLSVAVHHSMSAEQLQKMQITTKLLYDISKFCSSPLIRFVQVSQVLSRYQV